MITFRQKGNFSKTTGYFTRLRTLFMDYQFKICGERGVAALKAATPVDTGLTANSWEYQVVKTDKQVSIQFYNTHVEDGVNIAIILQYGHGTGTGGYVEGRDYINPAVKPIFDEMADYLWKEATRV